MLSKVFVLKDDLSAKSLWTFLKNNWRQLAEKDEPLQVEVSKWKEKRSIDQNKRYWFLLNEISEQAWIDGKKFSPDTWAEFFKFKFIGSEETPDGRMVGISTTILSVPEFSDYMTKIEEYSITELCVSFE